MTVYIVLDDDYEASIHAVFSTEEMAKKYIDRENRKAVIGPKYIYQKMEIDIEDIYDA